MAVQAAPQPQEDRSLYAEDFEICYNYWIQLLTTSYDTYSGAGSGWGPDGSGFYSGSFVSGSGDDIYCWWYIYWIVNNNK